MNQSGTLKRDVDHDALKMDQFKDPNCLHLARWYSFECEASNGATEVFY